MRPALAGPSPTRSLQDPTQVTHLIDSIRNNYVAGLMIMAEQLTSVMMEQVFVIGTFFDAKHQLAVQRTFQSMEADSHKEYQTSTQLCSFGTNIRSLAPSEALAEANASVINQRMGARENLSANILSAEGIEGDKQSRLKKFKETYCNPHANGGSMINLCGLDNDGDGKVDKPGGGPPDRIDKDINYMQTLGGQYTVDVDFTNTGAPTGDEEDILALSQNLFANDVFEPMPKTVLEKEQGKDIFLDMRSVTAMRSVARYSFAELVGMKAKGSPDSKALVSNYMANIMKDLGLNTTELEHFLGDNPSYFAQMEVLTNKIYQHPSFFVNLYQTKDNVERTGLAIQALELMNDRDRFESSLRREMLVSMILETQLRAAQEDTTDKLTQAFAAFTVK